MGTGTSALVSILACAGGDEVELEPEEAEAPIKPVRVTTAKGMYGFSVPGLGYLMGYDSDDDEGGGGSGGGGGGSGRGGDDDDDDDGEDDDHFFSSATSPWSLLQKAVAGEGAAAGDTYEQLEHSERLFLGEFVAMLQRGFNVTKHGRRGLAQARTLVLSGDEASISWGSRKSSARQAVGESSTLEVVDLCEVKRGAFAGKSMSPTKARCCFSLIAKQRTVNLETIDPEIRELAADGFNLLIKREKQRQRNADISARRRAATSSYFY